MIRAFIMSLPGFRALVGGGDGRWLGVSAAVVMLPSVAMGQSFQFRAENQHWYRAVSVPQGITWDEARAAASAQRGYLASIESEGENSFVYSLVDTAPLWFQQSNPTRMLGPWIGGVQTKGAPEPSGGWTWVDGSDWMFTRWEIGEPNNVDGREDALHFYGLGAARNSTWNDFPRSSTVLGYVVEADCEWVASQPRSSVVCPEGSVTFVFDAGATAPAQYQWEVRLGGSSSWNVLADGHVVDVGMVSGATSRALTVDRAKHPFYPAETIFRCSITSPCPDLVSSEAMLRACGADFNCSNMIDSQDVFDFLVRFFQGDADFDRNGLTDSRDFFEFLSAFFAGC